MKAIGQLGLVALAGVSMWGCGGGGSNPVVPLPAVPARTASIAAAQAAVTYKSIQPGILTSANSNSSSVSRSLNTMTHLYAKIAQLASNARTKRGLTRDWVYDPTTDTYYQVDDTSGDGCDGNSDDGSCTDVTIDLSSDGSSDNEGDVTATFTTDNSGSDSSSTPQYAVTLVLNILIAGQKITGNLALTGTDSSDFEVKGTLLTSVAGTITLDIINSGGTISGSIAGSIPSDSTVSLTQPNTVKFSNIKTSTTSNQLTANFADGSTLGTVVVNADGSGTATATDATGVWTLAWDTAQAATLTSPSGPATTGSLATIV